jgi:hypothetical protein
MGDDNDEERHGTIAGGACGEDGPHSEAARERSNVGRPNGDRTRLPTEAGPKDYGLVVPLDWKPGPETINGGPPGPRAGVRREFMDGAILCN